MSMFYAIEGTIAVALTTFLVGMAGSLVLGLADK